MAVPDLVTALVGQLGRPLVAYLGGVNKVSIVRQWCAGTGEIADPADIERLRLAFRAASLIISRESGGVAQAWFQGLNPALGDRSPARVLREDNLDTAGRQVLAAAREFAGSG
ncbi:hypothetical protein [Mycobacteroides abscessus]|uniref:hypothetical protein n=1 Tax=Mycobacteroides abscessus TaxID=36809 RepID=UPI0009A8F638|nr:hypothetical protein [Mycobacteroides abscessus]